MGTQTNGMIMFRTLIGYAAAVLVAYVLGAIFVSQGNISSVEALGFDVTIAQRLEASLHDILNMTDIYLILVAVSLFIGLPVAKAVIRFYPNMRFSIYVGAGFVAMIALPVIMKAVLGVSGIAPTRLPLGLLLQGIAGAAGGFVFWQLTERRSNAEKEE